MVFEALDTQFGTHVALKTLSRMEPEALLRFKREFRSLQDIEHRNVVHYEELQCEAGSWFLTMELLDGETFIDHMRPVLAHGATRVGRRVRALDETRLRDAFGQLVDGLNALHRAGRVHCDVKPSNLMVEHSGRLVLLDFGLVTTPDRESDAPADYVLGTPEYMSPEQARAETVTAATDWYAAGTVLYEALTGRVPFRGSPMQVVLDKQKYLPRHPTELNPDAPRDLSELCMSMLSVDPADRPDGDILRGGLTADNDIFPSLRPPSSRRTPAMEGAPFVGRVQELDQLRRCFQQVREGSPAFVYVGGESGVGKTALVQSLTDELHNRYGALVLSGRCYERETVPFKAFDGIVDGLAQCLARVPHAQCRSWLSGRAGLLAQTFPVLEQVEAIAEMRLSHVARDPNTLRNQAFAALRELLGRIALSRPLVLAIDDLQWSDRDSLTLLQQLLAGPDAPVCLVVATGRPLAELSSELTHDVAELLKLPAAHMLSLSGLSVSETAELARSVGGRALSPSAAHRIARDTRGHPLFVAELARYGEPDARPVPAEQRLHQALWGRITALEPEARALLDLLAVAGGPLSESALVRALGVELTTVSRRLMQLRMEHLSRSAGAHRSECYHDSVRRTVLDRMPAERRRASHRALALALSASDNVDYEQLADQWSGAGDLETAARLQARAAQAAARALAFDRAARLYRQALAHPDAFEPTRLPELRVAHGEALSAAGFSAEAADVFLAAAASCEGAPRRELQRRGAHLLLRSGKIAPGVALADRLLKDAGLSRPATPVRALGRLAWERARTTNKPLRDLGSVPVQSAAEDDIEQRLRLLWTVAPALAWFDPLGGMVLQSQYARLAMSSGVTHHMVRSLALDSVGLAAMDRPPQRRVSGRLYAAQALADRIDHPYLKAVCLMARGYADSFGFRGPEALAALVQAEALFREKCVDVAWERTNTRAGLLNTLFNAGQLRRQQELSREWLRDARDRGDQYAYAQLCVVGLSYHDALVTDEPDAADQNLQHALSGWPQEMYQLPQWARTIGQVLTGLYRGDGSASEVLRRDWPRIKSSQLLRAPYFALLTHVDAGWAALCDAAAADEATRRPLLEEATRHARRVRATAWPLADALSDQLLGQAALLRGDRDQAVACLSRAVRALREGHSLYQHPTAYLLGRVVLGDEGARLCADANEWATEEGVASPMNWFAAYAPALRSSAL